MYTFYFSRWPLRQRPDVVLAGSPGSEIRPNKIILNRTLILTHRLIVPDEFSKMKSEVPLGLVEAHMRTVDEAVREGRDIAAANYQLEKTGIAGTEKEEVAASPAEGATATPTPGTTTEQGRL